MSYPHNETPFDGHLPDGYTVTQSAKSYLIWDNRGVLVTMTTPDNLITVDSIISYVWSRKARNN